MSQFIMSYSKNAVITNIGYFEACAEINFGKLAPVKRIGILLYFYTPVFRRDVLWYGAVRPSVRPFVRPSDC